MPSEPLRRPVARPRPRQEQNPPRNNNRGGGNRPRNNGGGGNNNNNPPSPWLNPDQEPKPNANAGFTEYLRWMREYNTPYREDTKVQILQMAQENAKYNQHLKRFKKRTELIAGKNNTFEVSCPWRIRVGGHRGPEQILLPAFDALGIPYIPSSTLRGVARTQAIREMMSNENGITWKEAEAKIAPYFGSLEAEGENRGGKVVFLNSYPLPSNTGGLSLDIATSIWNWENNTIEYKEPNPNPFLSLEKPTFLIGLRLVNGFEDRKEILTQVTTWLKAGLQAGIGSQINTGYGKLVSSNQKTKSDSEFLRLKFWLEGQLIHGAKPFNSRTATDEVRPTAFKSMLRYWFRAFALGVMSPENVESWECELFGAIKPTQKWGLIEVNILEGDRERLEAPIPRRGDDRALKKWKKEENWGEQTGMLTLSLSSAIPSDLAKRNNTEELLENLTWLMFHLGGVGQGARRPRYSRKNRGHNLRRPYYRGSNLVLDSEDTEKEDSFGYLPENIEDFQDKFRKKIKGFYSALEKITQDSPISHNIQHPLEFDQPTDSKWYEAVDKHCVIVVCDGKGSNNKSYALSILHSDEFKIRNREGELDYDPNLCGKTAKPSPVWIRDLLDDYQVVTVFGATVNPRLSYLKELKGKSHQNSYFPIFPLHL